MRYWNTEQEKTDTRQAAFRDFRPRARAATNAPTSVVASSGSVRPQGQVETCGSSVIATSLSPFRAHFAALPASARKATGDPARRLR